MTILLIDNYDSFVYNLARYISELGFTPKVYRNDAITIKEIREEIRPTHIIISPGPCAPDQAGISLGVINEFAAKTPILGVCLGHQAIGQAYGGKVIQAKQPCHGKMSRITHDQKSIFKDIVNPLEVARYHSLILQEQSLPEEIIITARTFDGIIMAVRHQQYPIFGVQFHPESIMTQQGHTLLNNFLTIDQAND